MTERQPVIRVGLLGGLGNQLFQAAAGFAVTRRIGARLEFDVSRYREGSSRQYELAGLSHGATTVRFKPSSLRKLVDKVGRTIMPGRPPSPAGWRHAVFQERGFAYNPAIEAITEDCFLSGYFQSEKYFRPFADEIRTAFDLRKTASRQAQDFMSSMEPDSLAIHVRIGDYPSPAFAKVHAVLNPDYYRMALGRVCAQALVKRVYLFTDTPDIAPTLVPSGTPFELVAGFGPHDDMFLMSKARHRLIANSTFSWWAAWLAREAGGVTVAPARWFTPEEMRKIDTSDLYPERWIVL